MKFLMACLFAAGCLTVSGQRSHIVDIRGGFYTNFGVAYHDFYDSDSARHNFEWDQHFNVEYVGVSWRFPINTYLEAGLTYNHSFAAKSEIIEAESFFYGTRDVPSPGTRYAGNTVLKSQFQEFLIDVRLNHVFRTKKVQLYFVFSFGATIAENVQDGKNTFQADAEDLLSDLKTSYVVRDIRKTVGYGFGLDYPLRNGIRIKLIEAQAKVITDWEDSEILISKYGISLSTGISYQFKRTK